MADRSALDRLAIVAVVIAGVVEASQAALSNAPDVRRTLPLLNLSGLWNYAPFILLTLAGLLWAAERLLLIFNGRIIRPTSSVALEIDTKRKPEGLNWSRSPALRQLTYGALAVGVFALIVYGIILLARRVDEENSRTSLNLPPEISGSLLIGQSVSVSGFVFDKRNERGFSSITIFLTKKSNVPFIYAVVDGNETSYYGKGDHIILNCKVERVSPSAIGLNGCTFPKETKAT